ncbi:MAG: aminoglycoside phosphotransferase family protein [Lachnospiraceae bacterium]|nr:aminoglycoside phosphotransferase family protein [Lachnospiraceae bacterium]
MDLGQCIGEFALEGSVTGIKEYGSGHINATYLVETELKGIQKKYIFQRINTDIFQNVDHLMENITNVTSYLGKRIARRGGDASRETLTVIPTKDGGSYYRGSQGCFRMYQFISDASCFDAVDKPEDFYESAVAFGNFQADLSEFPAETLHETIPDFHNTGKRFETFCKVRKEDPLGRAALAGPEIAFVMERESQMRVLSDLLKNGELPLRVTHNDTKLNNIMMDNKTGKGICVIDLDTVMPGLSLYDFGDAIRFGANTGAEDETDLSKVSLDLGLFECYTKGYLKGCQGSLTETECRMLPMGAKIMTLECGMRFLTDYLAGDVYFKIHRKNHNLDRCRSQFALVADMEKNWPKMEAIVQKYMV